MPVNGLTPIIFKFADLHESGGIKLGVGPSMQGRIPLPAKSFVLTGQTVGNDGVTAVPGCTVHLFRTEDDLEIDMVTSDGLGNFEFRGCGEARQHYCVSYLPGSPDKAGTTVNTLVGA